MYHLRFKKRSAALLVPLLALLTGCQTQIKYVRELPPVELLANCPEVTEQVKTNGGLAATILEYRASLSTCNTDKEGLRMWAKE